MPHAHTFAVISRLVPHCTTPSGCALTYTYCQLDEKVPSGGIIMQDHSWKFFIFHFQHQKFRTPPPSLYKFISLFLLKIVLSKFKIFSLCFIVHRIFFLCVKFSLNIFLVHRNFFPKYQIFS